ncbi:MAG: DUF1573 domain-containing protein [Bacteroidota bacterium]|nr:DUF1573 domain-containing protein [Bacteroidota bacterium]
MKNLSIIFSIILALNFACNDLAKKVETEKVERISSSIVNNPNTASSELENGPLPNLTFEKLRHNFGEITQGESVSHQFTFSNTGKGDLIISNAKGSCGCTVPKWPKKPIAPGEEGEIKVTFNSNNREGKQQKMVTLVTNAIPNTTVLTITGNVIVKDKQTQN